MPSPATFRGESLSCDAVRFRRTAWSVVCPKEIPTEKPDLKAGRDTEAGFYKEIGVMTNKASNTRSGACREGAGYMDLLALYLRSFRRLCTALDMEIKTDHRKPRYDRGLLGESTACSSSIPRASRDTGHGTAVLMHLLLG